jgi:hypothetical protein
LFHILLIIHFLSFAAAIGAGLANMAAGIKLTAMPPDAMPGIAGFRMSLGKMSTVGLILLWLTGVGLVTQIHGWAVFSNMMFLMKLVTVIGLTVLSAMANMAVIPARKSGTPPDIEKMKRLGMASQALAVLALIFAVFAFS